MAFILKLTIITLCMLSTAYAAKVRMSGMSKELTTKMETLVKPRLVYINKRDATEWRADDAAFFLHQLLIKEGYSDCKVNWELPGNNEIILRTNLGTRYLLGTISSVSKKPLDQKLVDEYFAELITTGTFIKRENAPYLEDYPNKGAQNIANHLKSIGYWDAKVNVDSIKKQPTGLVDIQLNIQRGTLHKILQPAFKGVNSEHLALIQQQIAPYIQLPATTENISALNNTIHEYFRNAGYQFATLNISSQQINGIMLNFDIDTGNIYKIRKINVSGHERTSRSRFNRYTRSLDKEVYKEDAVNEITKQLLLTGAFESVRIIPQKIDDTTLDLNIEVKEAKPNFIRAYTGLASFDGFILGASYTNQNFLDKLQRFSVRSEISSRGLLGDISLTEPFFGGIPLQQTTRIYALQRDFEGYDKSVTGAELSFKWHIGDHLTSNLYGTVELVNLEASSLTAAELGLGDSDDSESQPQGDYFNARIGFEQTLDLRNDPVLPTSGFHAKGLFEYGTINGDASNSYLRTNLNTSYRYIIDKSDNKRIALRFNTGAIFPSDSNDLPIDLRLFSGGSKSIRSFGERELGPLSSSGDPLGGEAFWNFTAEYIHPFNDLISVVGFYDTGDLFSDAEDFSFSDPNHSIGLGLRLDLPIGPVKLEYGYNLNRKSGEPSGAVHFSIGAQF